MPHPSFPLGFHLEEIPRKSGPRWRVHWSFRGIKRISPVFRTRAEALEFAEFADVDYAADALEVSPRTVRRLVGSGELRAVQRDGELKIRWTELRRYAADRALAEIA